MSMSKKEYSLVYNETSSLHHRHQGGGWRQVYSWQSLIRRNTRALENSTNDPNALAKCLTAIDLVAYGIGSTVGAGIFVTIGIVATKTAGPAIVLSFLFAAFACLLSAFCYSEFAANIPVSGSAYTFSYVALGEALGWFIGWNLTLEYTISASAVARGWGGYVASLFSSLGVHLPSWFVGYSVNEYINLSPLSVLIVLFCSCILVFGVKDSARFNLVITIVNITTILFIIFMGLKFVDFANWDPFMPFGISGAFAGAGTVFFSYVGFDSVSSLAGEVKRPGRDLPIGIVGTLLIATVLYVAVSLVVTGMVKYTHINQDAPIPDAFALHNIHWASIVISIGSVTALTATTLCSLLGQPRIYYQMAKDGLLIPQFADLHPKTQAPVFGTVVTGIFAGLLALVLDLEILTDMISIGTLLAFTVVCAGVVSMRLDENGVSGIQTAGKKDGREAGTKDKEYLLHEKEGMKKKENKKFPDNLSVPLLLFVYFFCSCIFSAIIKNEWEYWILAFPGTIMGFIYVVLQLRNQVNIPSTFKCPLVPLLPLVGVLVNTFLIVQLPFGSIVRVLVWSAIGSVIYFGYGIRNSRLNFPENSHVSADIQGLAH